MASRVEKDIAVLGRFIQVYCDTKHGDLDKTISGDSRLCAECHETLNYAVHRREVCPLNPKPMCKNCDVHCFEPGQRRRIKEIMRHSGMHMIMRGRLDLLLHYFL